MKAIIKIERLGEIFFVSNGFKKIFGNNLIYEGQRIQDMLAFSDEEQNKFERNLQATVELGQKSNFIQEIRDKDGETIAMNICVAPIHLNALEIQSLLVDFEYCFAHVASRLDDFLAVNNTHDEAMATYAMASSDTARSIPASLAARRSFSARQTYARSLQGARMHRNAVHLKPAASASSSSAAAASASEPSSETSEPSRRRPDTAGPQLLRAPLKACKALRDAILFSGGAPAAPPDPAAADSPPADPRAPPRVCAAAAARRCSLAEIVVVADGAAGPRGRTARPAARQGRGQCRSQSPERQRRGSETVTCGSESVTCAAEFVSRSGSGPATRSGATPSVRV
jgi:hypothetical protein